MGKGLKDKFHDFELQPRENVWQNIHKENVRLGNTMQLSFGFKIISALVLSAIIATAIFILLNTSDDIKNIITDEKNVNIVDEELIVEEIDSLNDVVELTKVEDIFVDDKQFEESTQTEIILTEENIVNEKIESEAEENINTKTNTSKVIVNANIGTKDIVNAEINEENTEKEIVDVNNAIDTIKSEEVGDRIESFDVEFGSDQEVCFGENAQLHVQEGYKYLWNTGETTSIVTVSPVENTSYFVTVTNNEGLEKIHEYKVVVDNDCSALFVPSAFTPNGDGRNDVFKAEGRGIKELHIIVYNRNGLVVFETRNINDSWDGSFKGEYLNADLFVYIATYVDAKDNTHSQKGQITLIR